MTERTVLIAIYRSKPNNFQSPGGYWFLRISTTASDKVIELTLTPDKAAQLEAMGVPKLPDGGGL